MSHVTKVLELKEALNKQGVTSLDQQTPFIEEAFIAAIISGSFRVFGGVLCEQAQNKIICMLDMWNGVFPIRTNFILGSVKDRLNKLKADLLLKGSGSISPSNTTVVQVEDKQVGIEQVQTEFNNLFSELVKEFGNGE